MSTPNPVAPAATSTIDQIKDFMFKAVDWMGRQVVWLLSTTKDGILKVIEFVKPFFATINKFASEQFERIREFVVTNKEMVGYTTGALVVGILACLTAVQLCGGCSNAQGGETSK